MSRILNGFVFFSFILNYFKDVSCEFDEFRVDNHTPDNSLLSMPIGLTIGWGIAYRYLLLPAIGGREYLSIPIGSTNRFRLICAVDYCVWDRYLKSSIDTYLFVK